MFYFSCTDSSKPEQVETAAESLQDIPDYRAQLVCAVIFGVTAFRNLRFPFWTLTYITKLGNIKYNHPISDYYDSHVGLLHRLSNLVTCWTLYGFPTLVKQIRHSNLGVLLFDLPRLESVSLLRMLVLLLISH